MNTTKPGATPGSTATVVHPSTPTYRLRCQCYPGLAPKAIPDGWGESMLERFMRDQCRRHTGCRCASHRIERVS